MFPSQALGDAYGLLMHRNGQWEWTLAPGVSPSPRYQHAAVSLRYLQEIWQYGIWDFFSSCSAVLLFSEFPHSFISVYIYIFKKLTGAVLLGFCRCKIACHRRRS